MILCCGEALIDMLPRDLAQGGEGFMPCTGGALFNTAIALGRLGEKTGFFSSISNDMFGDLILNDLKNASVKFDLCPRLDKPTTLAFVKLTNGAATYSFFDENSAGRNLDLPDLPKLDVSVDALHFGAISLIPEPCGSAFEAFLSQNTDKVISLDPNIRPGFITDENAHRQRIQRMCNQSDIIKVSDEDLDWIVDGSSSEGQIAQWLEGQASVVTMTKGEDGATAYTKNGEVHQSVFPVEVVDTVGAGDTFNAGFLATLKQQGNLSKAALKNIDADDVQSALELAAKVSSIVVGRAGANPPWLNEL